MRFETDYRFSVPLLAQHALFTGNCIGGLRRTDHNGDSCRSTVSAIGGIFRQDANNRPDPKLVIIVCLFHGIGRQINSQTVNAICIGYSLPIMGIGWIIVGIRPTALPCRCIRQLLKLSTMNPVDLTAPAVFRQVACLIMSPFLT